MGYFYFLLGLWILVLVAMILSVRRTLKRRFALPYLADSALFSQEQLAFKAVLERAVGRGYRIYGKVRVADVMGLRGRLSRADQDRAEMRLDGRCFDFLVCTAETSAIVCALNLAPRSRLSKAPPRKDILDRICAAAGLPFVRIRESDSYSAEGIAKTLSAAVRAHQVKVRDQAPPKDEADEVLQGLSETIKDRERETPRPLKSGSSAARPARGADTAPRSQRPQAGGSRRKDPHILNLADVEEGPEFRIDGDLDETRPLRQSRR